MHPVWLPPSRARERRRDVRLPRRNVDDRVGQRDIDEDMRIGLGKIAEQRDDAQPPMRQRGTDPQPSPGRALIGDLLFGIIEVRQDPTRRLEIGLPLGRRSQRTGRPQEQPDAEAVLEGRGQRLPHLGEGLVGKDLRVAP